VSHLLVAFLNCVSYYKCLLLSKFFVVLKACNVLTQHLIPAAKHSEFLLHTNDLLFSGTVGHVLFSGTVGHVLFSGTVGRVLFSGISRCVDNCANDTRNMCLDKSRESTPRNGSRNDAPTLGL